MGEKLDATLAVLNGLAGDYLVRTDNGLATQMSFAHSGDALPLTAAAISKAYPNANGKLVVLVHGLMTDESIWRMADGSDFGTRLQTSFGYTPLYVRYNTGRPIADNGQAFAALLQQLLAAYPVPVTELLLLGYSMGGLVIRAACHVAVTSDQLWLSLVKDAIYVGTPHRGAPMERVGRVVQRLLQVIDDPYTKLIADIANLRSDGIKDLGDSDIRHEDRARRVVSVKLRDPQHPVPLLPTIHHHLAAGVITPEPWVAELLGDMLVPLASATDTAIDRVRVFPGLSHLALPTDENVYEQIREWVEAIQLRNHP